MPPVTDTDDTTLPALLRADLDDTGISVKELARRLAKDAGTAVESERRALQRYLKGEVSPEPEKAAAIAHALGQPEERYATAARLQVSVQELIADVAMRIEELRAEIRRADARARDRQAKGPLADRLGALEAKVEKQGRAVRDSLKSILELLEHPQDGAGTQRSRRGQKASRQKAQR